MVLGNMVFEPSSSFCLDTESSVVQWAQSARRVHTKRGEIQKILGSCLLASSIIYETMKLVSTY